jgi:hypothetical protein
VCFKGKQCTAVDEKATDHEVPDIISQFTTLANYQFTFSLLTTSTMKLSVIATLLFSVLSVDAVYFSYLNPGQTTAACTTASALGNAVLTLSGTSLCMKLGLAKLNGTETSSSIQSGTTQIATLPAGKLKTGCVTLSSANVASLNAGSLYFNIKTSACPNGETRGRIFPAPV